MQDFDELLGLLEAQQPVSFAPASTDDLNLLIDLGLPEYLVEFYRSHEPNCTADLEDVPELRWLTIKGILGEVSSMEPSYTLAEHKYIPVASTCYGNVYVFNCNRVSDEHGPEICFASHEKFMGGEDKEYVENNTESVAASLLEFTQRVLKGDFEK